MCYFVACAFSYFLFARAYRISLCFIQLTLDAYFIAASVTISLRPIHTISHFDFGPGWLASWLWMTTSFPVPSERQGNVHD